MTQNTESRKPYIFYNTWNFQERNKLWNDKPYLESMNEDRMLKEIDVAHRMGVDVFVLDSGWYEKTGDWTVSSERFPNGLKTVKARLDSYGMKLGLWIGPTIGGSIQPGRCANILSGACQRMEDRPNQARFGRRKRIMRCAW